MNPPQSAFKKPPKNKETLAPTENRSYLPLIKPSTHTMIDLTPAAQKELKNLLDSKNAPAGTGLRLSVEKGGCAGMSYVMKVAEPQPDDQTISLDNGAQVHLAADSLEYLKGCNVTYEYALTDSGFKIINPNAARSCGCGTSFEAKGEEGTYDPANECK